jgi:hypothetical protein
MRPLFVKWLAGAAAHSVSDIADAVSNVADARPKVISLFILKLISNIFIFPFFNMLPAPGWRRIKHDEVEMGKGNDLYWYMKEWELRLSVI